MNFKSKVENIIVEQEVSFKEYIENAINDLQDTLSILNKK